jgi:prephenate dehydratase
MPSILTLGPAHTFSANATQTIFPDAELSYASNFDQLFDRLSEEPSAIGVVPIENSLHGSVDEILDLLRETEVHIWQMHEVRIHHSFGCIDPTKVTTIVSHPQALKQCRAWIRKHYPNADLLPFSSTVSAAIAAKNNSSFGAIASDNALQSQELPHQQLNIEGENNTTRFGVVSLFDPFPEMHRTHMSIAIHPKPEEDRPGLLHQLLTPFKVYDINLTRIENRPTGKRLGDYNFFVDFLGSPEDMRVKKVMEEIERLASVRVLGEW